MTCASGTRRGSALSTPSTSVQMTISAASSSAPKIEAEKSLPLRPSVVCSPWVSVATNPVITTVPMKSAGSFLGSVRPGLVPAHAGPERAPLDQQHAARVEPAHVPAAPAAAAQQPLEDAVDQSSP